MSYTKGPWRWEFNQSTKSIQLCGGKPAHDMTVMCFARVGMNGATPLVLDPADPCVLVPASRFAQPLAGREHHKSWFQTLRQPDLDLIAAAPDMYEALKVARELISEFGCEMDSPSIRLIDAALAKVNA